MKKILGFAYLVVIIAIPVLIILSFEWIKDWQNNQPKPRNYVYACPKSGSTKCYELTADYTNEEGYAYISKIYFPEGGNISFSWCDEGEGQKMECYPDDTNASEMWTIQLTGQKTEELYSN